MKKKDLVTLLMSTVGGILFALCMTMVWNRMVPGIAVGIVGIVLLLCLIPIARG